MIPVHIVITGVVCNILPFNDLLAHRLQLICRIRAGTGVFVRQQEVHILENKGIAVRVAAGDEPLQSVAGDHTLPPAVCLVGLIVPQRCVGAAVTDLLQVAKQVFYHRCVRLSGAGSQRGQQPCRQ